MTVEVDSLTRRTSLLDRLRASAIECDQARDAASAAMERRNALIVEADDAGINHLAISNAASHGHALVSRSYVHKLLADADRWLGLG